MRLLFAFLVATVALSATVKAEDAPAAPVAAPLATVTQQDAGELNKILTEQIPAKWAQPVADWMNKLIARQASEKKPDKPADAPKS